MKVKFRRNNQPCIQYDLIEEGITEYNEQLKKYCVHSRISILGLVPSELLEEANCEDNIESVDVAIELTNNK